MLSWLNHFNLGGIVKEVTVTAPVNRDPFGLHILYPTETDGSLKKADIDIIAVHGLDGNPWTTWTEELTGRNWLRDFLPKVLPNARVMTFGYNSGVAFNNSISTIEDFAKELLNRIRMEHQKLDTDTDRPLIFICHSLGGIVVKKALILAHEFGGRYGFIKKCCRGIIFLGTPHRGSAAADLAKVLSTIVNTLTLSVAIPRTTLINDLRSDSGVLQTISKQFLRRTDGLEIISFYETEFIGAGAMSILAVNQDSATLGIVNEETIPINANHRNICKFPHEKSQTYMLVQGAVMDMVTNALKIAPGIATARPDEELRLQILQWLSPEPIESPESSEETYASKLGEREVGTCNWFWENSDVKDWLSDNSSILWVHGPPGAGKSVLCSSIISKLSTQHKVSYFFCVVSQRSEAITDTATPKPNSSESILRSLVVKLIEGSPEFPLPDGLKELYRRQKWRKSCPNGDLKDILQWILNILPRTYIIIDGLDEVDELDQSNPGQLGKLLKILEFKPLGIVKWLFTSQKTRCVDESIGCFKRSQNGFATYREIDLGDAEVDLKLRGEIKAMASATIKEKLPDLPDGLENQILPSLIHVAGSNFLCAKFLLNDLCDCPSIKDLIQSMTTYQPGLDNQYLRALRRIASARKACWSDIAKKILMYVTLALKPLTICEVQAALSVDVAAIGQCGKPGILPSVIKKICLPLVRVCPKKGTMKLVHHSVKAFLLKELGDSGNWNTTGIDDFFIDEKKGNTEMAFTCLSYLSKDRYSSFPPKDQFNIPLGRLTNAGESSDNECEDQNDVFLKYAAIFWHRHAEAAEPTPNLINLTLSFFQSSNFTTCICVQSLYAPYHFGTFISSDGSSVAYADTVPGWLESNELLGSKGKEMAFQYYSFVKEWGHVLGRYPGEIERCPIGTLGNIFFSRTETVADAHFLGGGGAVHYDDVHISNSTSITNLHGEGRILTLKSRSISPDTNRTILKSIDSKGPQKCEDLQQKGPDSRPTQALELWHYDPENKSIPQLRWSLPDINSVTSEKPLCGSKLLNCCSHPLKKISDSAEWPSNLGPLVASPSLDYAILNGRLFRLREPDSEEIQSLRNPLMEFQFPPILCTPQGICIGTYRNYLAIGATWECEKCVPDDDYFDAESDNEDNSGEDSGADSDACSSISGFAGTGFASEQVSYEYFKLLIYDLDILKNMTLLHEFGGNFRLNHGVNPFQYASPVFHPTHPLVAWALGPGEIIVADLSTGDHKIVRATKISKKSDIIARELHFSTCGELLYEIKITIKITGGASFNNGKIFLTTYPVRDPSSPDNKVQYFKWRLGRPVANARNFKTPTTTWTPDSVYISFSNICLSVCRIDLLREGAKLFISGANIALSTSALQKSVHFIPVGDNDATIALEGSQGYVPSLISAKGLLHWNEKLWYSEIDFTVTGGGKAGVFYECDEPSYIVAVRSGVIWTQRIVLQCG